MVSNSAATTDNSIVRVDVKALERIFKDEQKTTVQKQKKQCSTSRMRLTESLRQVNRFQLLSDVFEKQSKLIQSIIFSMFIPI